MTDNWYFVNSLLKHKHKSNLILSNNHLWGSLCDGPSYYFYLTLFTFCHVISHNVMLGHIMLLHVVTSCHVLWCCIALLHITLHHVSSKHVTWYHMMSRYVSHVMFCNVTTRNVTSCYVKSCHVISRYVTICHLMTRCIMLHEIMSGFVTSSHCMSHFAMLCHIPSRVKLFKSRHVCELKMSQHWFMDPHAQNQQHSPGWNPVFDPFIHPDILPMRTTRTSPMSLLDRR